MLHFLILFLLPLLLLLHAFVAVIFQNTRNQAQADKAAAAAAAADADTTRRNTIIIAVIVAVASVVGALILHRAVKGVILRAKQAVNLQRSAEKFNDEVRSEVPTTNSTENLRQEDNSVNEPAQTSTGSNPWATHDGRNQVTSQSRDVAWPVFDDYGLNYSLGYTGKHKGNNSKQVIRTASRQGVAPSSSTTAVAAAGTGSSSAGNSDNRSSSSSSSGTGSRAHSQERAEGPWGGFC